MAGRHYDPPDRQHIAAAATAATTAAALAYLDEAAGGDAAPAFQALFKVDVDGCTTGVMQAGIIRRHLIVPLVAAGGEWGARQAGGEGRGG